MSNTENKKTTDKTENATETAPYLKKNIKTETTETESPKGNFVIPMILLLVSAIVIVATFYEDEYNNLVTASSETLESVEATVEEFTASSDIAESFASITESSPAAPTATTTEAAPALAEETIAEPAPVQADASSVQAAPQVVTTAAPTVQKPATFNRVRMQPANAVPQQQRMANYAQTRDQAMHRAQMRAKQHNEMLQQRRHAYELEMQARRQQYEASIKAYQEQRTKVAEAQKAIFVKAQQNRAETAERLKELHKQISALHDELHQVMRQPYQATEQKAEQI